MRQTYLQYIPKIYIVQYILNTFISDLFGILSSKVENKLPSHRVPLKFLWPLFLPLRHPFRLSSYLSSIQIFCLLFCLCLKYAMCNSLAVHLFIIKPPQTSLYATCSAFCYFDVFSLLCCCLPFAVSICLYRVHVLDILTT